MDYNDYFDFELNYQQKEAFDAIVDFINSDAKAFILKGSAGTGKTTLVKGLCSFIEDNGFEPVLLATTGRAAKILKDKTGIDTSTIHSHIYILKQINVDEEGNEVPVTSRETKNIQTELRFVIRPNIASEQKVYIIDEASMISNVYFDSNNELKFGTGKLLNDIFKFTDKGKVIFVGDNVQLPPIKSAFSPALNINYLKQNYNINCSEYTLTKVERQNKKSGIINNAINIREIVVSKNYPKLKIHYNNYNDIVALNNDFEVVKKYIENLKTSGQDKNIFITLTNAVVNQVNEIVRRSLFQYNKDIIVEGEKMLVANNNYKFDLLNGDIITFLRFTGKKVYKKYAKLTFLEAEFEFNNQNIIAYVIKEFILAPKPYLTSEQTKALIVDFSIRMKKEHGIKSTSNSRFLEYFRTDPFLNALKLRYSYAVTCHKAQGGEWENVFLTFDPYLFKINPENRFRWVYTALTRAVKNVYFSSVNL